MQLTFTNSLNSSKGALMAEITELSNKLENSNNENDNLSKKVHQIKTKFDEQLTQVHELQCSLDMAKYITQTLYIRI